MEMNCLICGELVHKGQKHCDNCGTPVEQNVMLKKIVGNIVLFLFFVLMIGVIGASANYLLF